MDMKIPDRVVGSCEAKQASEDDLIKLVTWDRLFVGEKKSNEYDPSYLVKSVKLGCEAGEIVTLEVEQYLPESAHTATIKYAVTSLSLDLEAVRMKGEKSDIKVTKLSIEENDNGTEKKPVER